MKQPVAITDDTARDVLPRWQELLSRFDIDASIESKDGFNLLLVPSYKVVQARLLLFKRP